MKKLIDIWSKVSIAIIVLLLVFILVYIGANGLYELSLSFITEAPRGIPMGSQGGVFPAIVGSLLTTILAGAIAGFMAISTAIYSVFYVKSRKANNIISTIVQCISGVPSIILGLFGYAFFVVNLELGKSVISASLTLAIMIFPFIEVRVEKILREFRQDYIVGSYALGVSKEYTILKLILPGCKKEIFSAIAMAEGFAMGATAPIMLTGAVVSTGVPENLKEPFMALPYHLYIIMQQGLGINRAYGTALVLIILVLIINILGAFLGGTRRNE